MYLMDDGIRLNAVLEMPDNAPDHCPIVVIAHGFGGNCEERHIVAAAKAMNEAGYATLRLDLYGHGKSEGAFEDHTLYKLISNMMVAVDYVKALPFVTDVYLCGHSQGGLTCMLTAALEHDVVKGLITLSPATMIPELARKGKLLFQTFDPKHLPEYLNHWDGRRLGQRYIRVAQAIDAEEICAAYHGPVLWILGDKDQAIPFDTATEFIRVYENAQLVRIEGDDHCYTSHLDQVCDAIRRWLP